MQKITAVFKLHHNGDLTEIFDNVIEFDSYCEGNRHLIKSVKIIEIPKESSDNTD